LAGQNVYSKYVESTSIGIPGGTFFVSGVKNDGPILSGSFCKIIDYVSGDDFSGYVDNTKETNGTLNTDNFEFYCNKDLYWYNGSKVFYTYTDIFSCFSGCCANLMMNLQNFAVYYEYSFERPSQGSIPITETCQKYNCCDFREEIDQLFSTLSSTTINEILDVGIMEIGDTNFEILNNYFEGKSESFKKNYLIKILEKGLVMYCDDDSNIISSVETYLKYAEAIGITGLGGGIIP
jgi:hypothetical protein